VTELEQVLARNAVLATRLRHVVAALHAGAHEGVAWMTCDHYECRTTRWALEVRAVLKCEYCTVEFLPTPNTKGRYCSRACCLQQMKECRSA